MKTYLMCIFLGMAQLATAQSEIIPTFSEKWDNSKLYLIQVAQAMPEEHYDYQPTQQEMTFKNQLFHILDNMDWLSTTYFSAEKHTKKDRSKITAKTEIIAEIEQAFNQAKIKVQKCPTVDLYQKVDFFAGPKTKLQILNLLQDHVTHHRGQLVVYLNIKAIKPPKYVGW